MSGEKPIPVPKRGDGRQDRAQVFDLLVMNRVREIDHHAHVGMPKGPDEISGPRQRIRTTENDHAWKGPKG